MGGRMSRNKGAAGEREVIGILQPVVDRVCEQLGRVRMELRRNHTQRYTKKEYDVIGLPWMALEVKRVEDQSGLEGWWRQTLAATRDGQIPVLMWRKNRGRWRVRMWVPVGTEGKGVRSVAVGRSSAGDGPGVGDGGNGAVRRLPRVRMTVDTDLESFLVWFELKLKIELGGI